MARRAERVAGRFKRLKLKLGGGDGLDVERVRAVRSAPSCRCRSTSTSAGRSTRRSRRFRTGRARRRVFEQPLPAADPVRPGAAGALADPDLRRRGLPPARRRRPLCRDRARDQHQAREIGRDPRGGPDRKRGSLPWARGDDRLHDRVGLGIAAGCVVAPLCDHVDFDGNLLIADDPYPGSLRRRRSGAPRGAGSRCRSSAAADPGRGLLGRPAYGKTIAGSSLRRDDVVAILDSTRAGKTERVPVVERVEASLALNPTTALVGVATQGGRFPPAWRQLLKSASGTGSTIENGLHEFIADDAELISSPPRIGVELTDLRRPPADLDVPTGRTSSCRGRRSDGLRLRDREDHSLARARPRGPRPRARIPLRPDRADGDRDRRLGHLGRLGRRGFHRRCGGAARRGGRRAWGRAPDGRRSGLALASRLFGRHARSRPRLGAARLRALPPGGATEVEGYAGHPLLSLRELIELHERISLPRGGRSSPASRSTLGSRRVRGAQRSPRRAETGLVADDPVRFGARRLLDAVLAHQA